MASPAVSPISAFSIRLVLASTRLLALATRTAEGAVGARVVFVGGGGKLDGDLVAAGEVGVGDFRVGHLKGRAVLHVEGQLSLAELGLAPVPAAQGVLLVLEGRAVPVLEELRQALKLLLREAVELDDAGVAAEDLDLVALGGATPLGGCDGAGVEGEGVTSAGGLPSQARLGESALAARLGQIQEDAVEALAVGW
ncbi:hypothetical protein VDGD_20950 [Verticillium dahliae]|nr:hypothetical protein VDGD_20950 [Verticillium dahliae]